MSISILSAPFRTSTQPTRSWRRPATRAVLWILAAPVWSSSGWRSALKQRAPYVLTRAGLAPTVVIEEELPEELKKKADLQNTRGESNLRGHLKGESEGKGESDGKSESESEAEGAGEGEDAGKADEAQQEESGSSSYVPQDKEKDTQLKYALDLLRGIKSVDTEAKKKAEAN